MILSSITLSEIAEILSELEVEYEVIDENSDAEDPEIACETYEHRFMVYPDGHGPFFESFTLYTMMGTDIDPSVLCIDFNSCYDYCTAIPAAYNLDDDDETEFNAIRLRTRISLFGGVSKQHLLELIRGWIMTLCIAEKFFNGAQEDEEVDDNA